jgi:two-component system OmpR family sensor kinase
VRAPGQLLSALPLRARLTLAYTGVMAFVLAIVGAFLFLHFRSGLNQGIDAALATRAHDVAAVSRSGDPAQILRAMGPRAGHIGDVAQVVSADGRVVAGTPTANARMLLSAGELARARRGRIVRDRGESLRLLAQPVGAGGRVVVVGVALAQRERALETLTGALLIGGPLALLLASAAGYALAAGSLRPVESMRRRAATISAADPDARLPLPAAHDEIRRLGHTLNEMLARLAEARRHERAFVADASHELRTPLAILQGELELAAAGDPDRDELVRVVASATEETDRLVALAEELLALARLDEEGLTVRARPVAARELLEEVTAAFAPRAAAEGRTLVVVAPAGVVALGDALQLRQALDNLVDNALRYGGGTIRLDARAGDEHVELRVRDEGAGFPPGLLERAFDRFARGEGERRAGAGLGLSIVAAVAAAHGGSAHAANAPGGGGEVWIVLPADRGGLSSPFHEGPRP